jgi:hypothetical protein
MKYMADATVPKGEHRKLAPNTAASASAGYAKPSLATPKDYSVKSVAGMQTP